MTEETKVQPTETLKFRWATFSPDPHTVTMRNSLEPVEVFVEVKVPLKKEYFANIERLIKISIGADDLSKIEPILTLEGMKYVVGQLSLEDSEFESEIEVEDDLADEDWDSDEDFGDDENFEDDEDWEDG